MFKGKQCWYLGFPGGTVVKNLSANAGDTGDLVSIPGLGRSPGVGNSNSLQYSCLENVMDKGVWWATVHRVTKGWTRPSDWAWTHTMLIPIDRRYFFSQEPHSSPESMDGTGDGGAPRLRLCPGTLGQAWSSEESRSGQPWMPEAGVVPCFFALNNDYLFDFFPQWAPSSEFKFFQPMFPWYLVAPSLAMWGFQPGQCSLSALVPGSCPRSSLHF